MPHVDPLFEFKVQFQSFQSSSRKMSTFVETVPWEAEYGLHTFPWSEWIGAAAELVPMAVYDLSKILDSCAAYEMALYARHWSDDGSMNPVHVPAALRLHMACAGVTQYPQQVYFARAMYAHCARYTAGVPRIANPPTWHMANIAIVPATIFSELVQATMATTDGHRRQLMCWLENVLVHRSTRSTTLGRGLPHVSVPSGRRRRRQSTASGLGHCIEDIVASVNRVLRSISDHAPALLPTMYAAITTSATRMFIELNARQPALCDE